MSLPTVAADFPRLNTLTKRHRDLQAEIQRLYAEWEGLEQTLRLISIRVLGNSVFLVGFPHQAVLDTYDIIISSSRTCVVSLFGS